MEKLICIITGPERNGTTFVEKIVFSHPDIFGGFETGLLLKKDFKMCKPFCEWIHHGGFQWGLSSEIDLTGRSFKEKYDLLFKYKGSHHESNPIQKLIYESKYLVDKTPAYIRNLEFVHKNTPSDIPIIIVIKNLEDDYISKVIKRNGNYSKWEAETKSTLNSLKYIEIARKTQKNIFLFSYDDIAKYTDNFIKRIKNILQHKININVEMSIAEYIKKVGETEAPYGNWKPSKLKLDKKFQKCKNLQIEYNNLINKLKENISNN